MQFILDDGGRKKAGYKGRTGDCVVRAIAIATGLPYQEVYDAVNQLAKGERTGRRKRKVSNARKGVFKQTYRRYLASLGWRFVSTMSIGSGCTVHLADGELPSGRLIVKLSRHLVAVIDGVIHDTYNPQRSTIVCEDGVQRIALRCVYGYFVRPCDNVANVAEPGESKAAAVSVSLTDKQARLMELCEQYGEYEGTVEIEAQWGGYEFDGDEDGAKDWRVTRLVVRGLARGLVSRGLLAPSVHCTGWTVTELGKRILSQRQPA